MQTITKPQTAIIGTICSKLKYTPDEKGAMISSFSQGRATHTPDLYFNEAMELIRYLNDMQKDIGHNRDATKMIGKIFYYAHEMGWTKRNPANKTVADGPRVDAWMLTHSYAKKKLNAYSYAELPKLVSQFEMVYKSFLKRI